MPLGVTVDDWPAPRPESQTGCCGPPAAASVVSLALCLSEDWMVTTGRRPAQLPVGMPAAEAVPLPGPWLPTFKDKHIEEEEGLNLQHLCLLERHRWF